MIKNFNPENWISIKNAAILRGISRQAMTKLVKKDRFRTITVSDVLFIYKEDVVSFRPVNTGRPVKRGNEEAL
jgi:hypothetical protein